MKPYRASSQSLVLPLRSWLLVGGSLSLVVAALTLSTLASRDHPVAAQVKHALADAVTPAIATLSAPSSLLDRIGGRLGDLIRLDEENRRLRDENAALLHWQIVARKLETENAALRGLLTMPARPGMRFVTASVVAGGVGAFNHTLLLANGRRDGIAKDQAVIAEAGLVGRIIDTAAASSQVLLLTDINSRIPVAVVETGEKAILSGDNTAHPQLRFENGDAKAQPGQKLVTTADGGVFPAGFAVGEISRVDHGKVEATPFVNASRLDFVRAVLTE